MGTFGIARADLIEPEEAERIKNLTPEQRLAECKSLLSWRPEDVFSFDYEMIWSKQWYRLDCDSVLDEQTGKPRIATNEKPVAQPQAETPQEAKPATPEETTDTKQDMRAYELTGLLVLLLSGIAFILLWRTKKTVSRAL